MTEARRGEPGRSRPEDEGLIHAYVLDGRGGGRALGWDEVEAWRPGDGVLWLHLDYASPRAHRWLGEGSGLPPLVRDALLDRDPRPRATAMDGALLLILRSINRERGAEPEDLVSLRCWIEPARVVTLRHRAVQAVKAIGHDVEAGRGPVDAGGFVVELAERIVEPLAELVDAIDDAGARLEAQVLGRHGPELRAQLADVRRRAITLRRFMAPQRDAFARLGAMDAPMLGDGPRARLREAADRLTRTLEELDTARERAAVTHEELSSRLAEVTNQRLYVLSLMAAVFLPLGFVTQVLGVNVGVDVGGIPGQRSEHAFWIMLGAFAVVIAAQLWIFRRKKWL